MLLRIFRARLRPGHEEEALRLLRSSVEDVARTAEGLHAIHLARRLEGDVQLVEVVSIWRDADALAAAFGPAWQRPHLPGNLEELVDRPVVDHMETIFDYVATDDRPPPLEAA